MKKKRCCSLSSPRLHQGKGLYLAATMLMEEEIPFPAWLCGSLHRPEGQMLNVSQALPLTPNHTTPSPYFIPLLTEAQPAGTQVLRGWNWVPTVHRIPLGTLHQCGFPPHILLSLEGCA